MYRTTGVISVFLVLYPKTKSGYAKDGFIVDDDELSDDDYEDTEESEEEIVQPKKKKPTQKSTKKTEKVVVPDNVFMELSNEIDELLDSTKELEKENYI